MYRVRETISSRLRTSRGPDAHALEHRNGAAQASRSAQVSVCRRSVRQAIMASSEPVLSTPCDTVEDSISECEGSTNSHCSLNESAVLQGPALDSLVEAQLASQALTIAELQGKLQVSEQLASDQSIQLAEIRLALKVKDACFHKMVFSFEKANSNTKENVAQIKELKERLTIVNSKVERKVQAEAELLEQMRTDQHILALQQERIQQLEEQLENAGSLQMQLKEATVQRDEYSQAEAQLRQEVARMQEELGHLQESARAEGQLRQEVSNLKKQLRSSQDLLKEFKDIQKTDQQIMEELAKQKHRQVTQELAAKEEELALLCGSLKEEQKKALSHEVSVKLLQDEVERFSSMRSELEHRNGALEKEIVQLKLEVRRYAEIIVGNEGKPFYEVRPTESSSAVGLDREERREAEASEEEPIPQGQDTASESAQTRLSRGQEAELGRNPSGGLLFALNQQLPENARLR